jgi:hypothetical protein
LDFSFFAAIERTNMRGWSVPKPKPCLAARIPPRGAAQGPGDDPSADGRSCAHASVQLLQGREWGKGVVAGVDRHQRSLFRDDHRRVDPRGVNIEDKGLLEQVKLIQELDQEERAVVFKMIDTFLMQKRFKEFFEQNMAGL